MVLHVTVYRLWFVAFYFKFKMRVQQVFFFVFNILSSWLHKLYALHCSVHTWEKVIHARLITLFFFLNFVHLFLYILLPTTNICYVRFDAVNFIQNRPSKQCMHKKKQSSHRSSLFEFFCYIYQSSEHTEAILIADVVIY